MALLVIDVDDTLLDSTPAFLESLNKRSKFKGKYEGVYNADFRHTYPDLEVSDMHDAWLEDKVLENLPWFGDKQLWVDLSHRLNDIGHDIVYCTARDWHPDAQAVTEQSLLGVAGSVLVTPLFASKAETLKDMNMRPSMFVDDNFENVAKVHAEFSKCYSVLMYRPWNYLAMWANRVITQAELHAEIENIFK